MRFIGFLLAACAVLALGAAATASQANAEEALAASGRYQIVETEDGILRLDTETGDVSVCSPGSAGWSCQLVPDDRAAYQDEIEELARENEALKGMSDDDDQVAEAGSDDEGIPSEEQIDKAASMMKSVMRHMARMARELREEMEELEKEFGEEYHADPEQQNFEQPS